MFNPEAEALRRRVLKPWGFRLYLLGRLPLGAFAGMRIERLDESECRVSLPGGWRTQNPFGSTYFAAQCMAAELSTGAPALVLAAGAAASTALIVVGLEARFAKRVVGASRYSFTDLAGMKAAIDQAGASDEPVTFVARATATTADGTPASEFAITWSFKRRAQSSA